MGRPSLCRRAFASDVRCGCRLPRTDRASSEWRLALCPDRHAVPAARGRETIMHITEEMSERHVLTLTVANEAGILARIAGMFTARGYNIESLTVADRSEEHTSELQSLMRISYAVFCLKKKKYNFTRVMIAKNRHQKQRHTKARL